MLRCLDVENKMNRLTEREHKLMSPPQTFRYDAEKYRERERNSPQREVVRVEKDKLERRPGHGEVVLRDAQRNRQPATESVEIFQKLMKTDPVSMRNAPTPPIHPTKICRGKNPMRRPSLRKPRRKKDSPVSEFKISSTANNKRLHTGQH
jgi:hypothetical protein